MSLAPFLTLAAIGFVVWFGRRIPLAGWRKRAAIAARAAAIAALCTALLGGARVRTTEVPRRLVYLVDGSASIDPAQRAWFARRIASLETLRPRQMERAVAVFGADTRSAVPFGREPLDQPEAVARALEQVPVTRTETNLETALLSVPGLLGSAEPSAAAPASSTGRTAVVLLSDGRETTGSAAGVLAAVRRLGIGLFPVPPPASGKVAAVWDQLAVPPVVQKGSPIPLRLVVFNGSPRAKEARVTVSLQGVALKRQRLSVRPGWQVFTLTAPTVGRGTMALAVRLDIPEDALSEERRAYTEVEGPPRLLFVGDRAAGPPMLGAALRRREVELSVSTLAELPIEASPLLDYDAVLLFNVPKSSLSPAQAAALQRYVEGFGGGLILVGLGGDLTHELATPSPLDTLLPVTFEPKGLQESKRRVCMILLIDRSASMLGPRIAATKRAAVALVNQLAPEDLVGILVFDTQAYVLAEVQPAGQVSRTLVEKLVKLRSSGGTDVYPALTASSNRLDLTGATLKHIILLSDGNTPFHRQAYEALVKSFALEHITVSTIGIGSAFINTDYLQWLARSTGGTYYQLDTLEDLPRLVARDTEDQLGRLPFTEGLFRPAKTPESDWFADTADWPSLRGYLTATAKPGSRVDVTVNAGEADDPLLARWTLGRGRVAAFTSDADTRWSPDWIRWRGFEGVWAQVVRWTMRPRLTEELFVRVDESGEIPQLIVEGAMHDPKGSLVAAAGGLEIPVSLVQTGTWRWQASLEQTPSGWYQLALEAHPPGHPDSGGRAGGAGPTAPAAPAQEPPAAIFAKRWVQVGTPPASQELTGQPPLESLLRGLARATSGAYDAPDAALLPPTTSGSVTEPLLAWWLPFVILLVLIDVALRGPSML
jgi:Mg-chelatase subunit ChlD